MRSEFWPDAARRGWGCQPATRHFGVSVPVLGRYHPIALRLRLSVQSQWFIISALVLSAQ